jgi:hypothetical protein
LESAHEEAREIVFTKVDIPEDYRDISVSAADVVDPRCPVCRSENREVIEVIGFSGMSMRAASAYIEKNLGERIPAKKLKEHLASHFSDIRSLRFSQLCQSMGDMPEDAPVATAQGLLMLMLSDAMSKVINGQIEVNHLSDVERVIKLQQAADKFAHDKVMDERKMDNEEQGGMSAADAMRQLGYIMMALRETVPPEILERAATRAWSLGLNMDFKDISDVPIYQTDYVEPDMSLAVTDKRSLGRKRTRDELDEADWEPVVGEDVPPED